MIVAVIGSRTFSDYAFLKKTLECLHITKVISGGSTGADQLAEEYAREKNIPLQVIPHTNHPETPNAPRTYEIVAAAQTVVAFWDGKSPGTSDLIKYTRQKGRKLVLKYFTVAQE